MSTNESRGRTVVAQALSEDAWAPFGWLPVADTDPRDGKQRMTFEWDSAYGIMTGGSLARSSQWDRQRSQMREPASAARSTRAE